MKKLFALLMAVAMILSMAACGKTDTPAPSDPGASQTTSWKKDVVIGFHLE